MRAFARRVLTGSICIALLLTALLWPGLPWSARCRHVLKKMAVRAEMKVSAWQGEPPKIISLRGRVFTKQPDKEYLKGAEVEALDSLSGWASLTDRQGKFMLPDVVWYPRAKYSLIFAASPYQVRQIEVAAPADYPKSGELNLGELDFDRGCQIDPIDLQGSNSNHFIGYDKRNDDYYCKLFEELTEGKKTDEEKLDAIARYVSSRLIHNAPDETDETPRRILERGSRKRGLALALATIATAGNYSVRLVDLIDSPYQPTPHVVAEVYYDDGWHLYDPLLGESFSNMESRAASYKELRLDTSLIRPGAKMQTLIQLAGYRNNWMPDIYCSGIHHYYYLGKK